MQLNGSPEGGQELKPNIFGMHLKAAVEKLGGRKFKSGGQIYEGVRLPPEWRGARPDRVSERTEPLGRRASAICAAQSSRAPRFSSMYS